MGFWTKKSKQTVEKPVPSTRNVDPETKADALCLYDQGEKPSDIAKELGINVEIITRLVEFRKRKQIRQQISGSDPVTEAKQALEAEKIKLQVDKLAFERVKFKDEQLEYTDPPEIDQSDDPINTLIMSYLANLPRKDATGTIPGSVIGPPLTDQEIIPVAPQQMQQAPIDLEEEEIQKLIDQHPKQVKLLQGLNDQAIKSMILTQMPQLSARSLDLALGLIKKKDLKVKT